MRNDIVIGSTIALGLAYAIIGLIFVIPDIVGGLMVASLIVPIGLGVK